jgi:hypothetical protein
MTSSQRGRPAAETARAETARGSHSQRRGVCGHPSCSPSHEAKARKTIKNPTLIQEVISQISQQFTTKIPEFRKAIETLLEKEYIKRVDGSKDTFANVV